MAWHCLSTQTEVFEMKIPAISKEEKASFSTQLFSDDSTNSNKKINFLIHVDNRHAKNIY